MGRGENQYMTSRHVLHRSPYWGGHSVNEEFEQ